MSKLKIIKKQYRGKNDAKETKKRGDLRFEHRYVNVHDDGSWSSICNYCNRIFNY